MENITQFFYNIIPGTTFLLLVYFVFVSTPVGIESISTPLIFIVVILSMLIGFTAQALFKFIRNQWLDEIIWEEIKGDNEKIYNYIKNHLKKRGLIDEENNVSINKQLFHTIDNYLKAKELSGYTSHFMPRVAYWSNLFILSITSLILLAYKSTFTAEGLTRFEQSLGLAMLVMLGISKYMLCLSLRSVYEVILKTFASIRRLK